MTESDEERAARGSSFGTVAADYDRYRPGYPAALYDDVLALAPGRRVLEAGAGTGRATLGLAARGATVTAVEHDAAMADVARRRTAGYPVTLEQGRFEDHAAVPGEADLVVAAQAWHWVDQVAGPAVAARALSDDGLLACWWNLPGDMTDPAWASIERAYTREAPELGWKRVDRPRPASTDLDTAPGFTGWSERDYEHEERYDAASYTGMVATHSDHIRLPAARRERLLAAVGDAIVAHGGVLVLPYRTLLIWALRAGERLCGP